MKMVAPKLRVLVCVGAVRGCGWQKIGACINLGSYYLVGIPVSILLAFVAHVGGKVWIRKMGIRLSIVTDLFGAL